jgi:hypothetical protein
MTSITRAIDAMLGTPSATSATGKQRDNLVRDLKAKGFCVTEFQPDVGHLDERTAQTVAALARQGLAVTGPGGSPLGAWKAV